MRWTGPRAEMHIVEKGRRHRWVAWVRVLLVIGVALGTCFSSNPVQAAWPWGGCDDTSPYANYVFGGWPDTVDRPEMYDAVDDGFWTWVEGPRYWRGGNALNKGGRIYTVLWGDIGSTGLTKCDPNHGWSITFNIDDALLRTDPSVLQGVATHEFGHAFGFRHAGGYDSHDSDNPPTMATCGLPGWTSEQFFESQRTLSQDDSAAVQYETNTWTDPQTNYLYRTFTANPSFEEGRKYWGQAYLSYFRPWSSGGGADGSPSYVAVKPKNSSGRIYQTTRYTAGSATITLRARVKYRKYLAADTGYVKVFAGYRKVTYSSGADPGCQFPGNKNLNDPHPSRYWYYTAANYCHPSSNTSWGSCGSGSATVTGDVGDGWDLRVYVYPRMMISNHDIKYYDYVRIDRTRVLVNR